MVLIWFQFKNRGICSNILHNFCANIISSFKKEIKGSKKIKKLNKKEKANNWTKVKNNLIDAKKEVIIVILICYKFVQILKVNYKGNSSTFS